MLDAATRYRGFERSLAARQAELAAARAAEQSARQQVAATRTMVGTGAAGLYRSPVEARTPLLELDVHAADTTADVLHLTAIAERAAQDLEVDVVRAERAAVDLTLATRRVAVAEAALATVQAQATAVLDEMRAQVGGLRTDVAARLADRKSVV